ncbi:MAG TPA: hypothetical protein VKQ08_06270, partial [Cyclobacteriaceae bacterium]|nr:hypothetical protein [Cyclobacteriaceae bacterium]
MIFLFKSKDWIAELANRNRLAVAFWIITVSYIPLVSVFDAHIREDARIYERVADDLLAGKLPYRDITFGYPPYSIPIFVLPRLFGNHYLFSFMILALVADSLIKLELCEAGSRQSNQLRGIFPVLIYSVAVPFLRFFYLQRYDIWPTLLSLLAVSLFCSGRFALSGLAVAIGTGLKV